MDGSLFSVIRSIFRPGNIVMTLAHFVRFLRKLQHSLRVNPRLVGTLSLVLVLLAGALLVQQRAADEAQARQLPEVRTF